MGDLNSMVTIAKSTDLVREPSTGTKVELSVALLTGCQDKSYALGLAMALSSKGVRTNVIGNDLVDSHEYRTTPNLRFLNLGGIQKNNASVLNKLFRLLNYYAGLLRYVTFGGPRVIHVLWNSKFEYFDRTFLMLYIKLLGKRVV